MLVILGKHQAAGEHSLWPQTQDQESDTDFTEQFVASLEWRRQVLVTRQVSTSFLLGRITTFIHGTYWKPAFQLLRKKSRLIAN